MTQLPVRDLEDAPLAKLFAGDGAIGCPLCRREEAVTTRFLETILYESVNDVRFRGELDAARGFCHRHVREVLRVNRATTGSLSSAILFGALLTVRRRELDAARRSGWSRGRRLSEALRPPDCPACSRAAEGIAAAVGSLVRLSAQPAWASAIADAPFCLDHLVMLMREPRKPETWDRIEDRQVQRLQLLAERLASFIHHSSEDRGDQVTEEEQASVDEVARVLSGGRSDP